MLKGILIGGGIGLVIYALRIQFMSDFGNIWIRPDQFGIRRFRPLNLLWTMLDTFKFPFMWRLDMIDINWVYYVITFGMLGSLMSIHSKTYLNKNVTEI